MTYGEWADPQFKPPFGTLAAKINYFKEMKVNTSLKFQQDGEVGEN